MLIQGSPLAPPQGVPGDPSIQEPSCYLCLSPSTARPLRSRPAPMSGVPVRAGGAEGSDLPVLPSAPSVLSPPSDPKTASTRSVPSVPNTRSTPCVPSNTIPSSVPCAPQCPQCPHLGTGSPPQRPDCRHQAQGTPNSPQQHQPMSSGAGGSLPGPQGPLVPLCWAGQRRAWGETGVSSCPGGVMGVSQGSRGVPGWQRRWVQSGKWRGLPCSPLRCCAKVSRSCDTFTVSSRTQPWGSWGDVTGAPRGTPDPF